MEATLDWGVTIILWFQQFSPTLDIPFKVFTLMGEEIFSMLLMLLLYWCIDRRTGVRLAILFLFSGYVNTVAKVLADQPRPFHYNTQVHKLFAASRGGLPSGDWLKHNNQGTPNNTEGLLSGNYSNGFH